MKNIFLVLFICLVSCDPSSERDCPSFYYDHSKWIDYQLGEEITFISSDSAYITFTVEEITVNDPYTASEFGCAVSDCVDCYLYKQLVLSCTDSSHYSFSFFIDHIEEGSDGSLYDLVSISIGSTDTVGYYQHFFYINPITARPEYHQSIFENYEINNILYDTIFHSSIDTNSFKSENIFREIYMAKDNGLVQFKDRSFNMWTLK